MTQQGCDDIDELGAQILALSIERKDPVIRLLTILVLFGVLFQPVNGAACGIEHCMKCDGNNCMECEYGWYGRNCTKKCQSCWYGGCDQDTGICKQCTPGYYTQSCLKTCPHNCRLSYDDHRHCNRTTGHCLEGCEVSYWGSRCDRRCSTNCEKSVCEQRNGVCLEGCVDGSFGIRCDKLCPNNCLPARCSLIRGECSEGCKHGFYGRMCNISCDKCIDEKCTFNGLTQLSYCTDGCKNGFYGPMCNISCDKCIDEKCTFNELTQLSYCTDGCKDGWTSTDCKQTCSSRCQYGICERNGTCQSCPDGYYGNMCTRECQNCQKCEKKTGQCITHYGPNDGIGPTTRDSDISDDGKNVSVGTTHSIILLWWTYLVTHLISAL